MKNVLDPCKWVIFQPIIMFKSFLPSSAWQGCLKTGCSGRQTWNMNLGLQLCVFSFGGPPLVSTVIISILYMFIFIHTLWFYSIVVDKTHNILFNRGSSWTCFKNCLKWMNCNTITVFYVSFNIMRSYNFWNVLEWKIGSFQKATAK